MKTISKTKKIFCSLSRSHDYFHKCIDDVSDIVILIKTEQGQLIGGFSEPALSKEMKEGKALLISLTNKEVYKLIKGKHSFIYEELMLVFGNSELRIKER